MTTQITSRRLTVASFAAVTLLSGCLMNDSVEQEQVSAAPPPAGNTPPLISGTPPQAVRVGVNYTFTPVASDVDNDPLTFAVQNPPNWASFDTSSGTLSGVPALGNEGTYPGIVISADDGSVSSSLAAFDITVEPMTAPNLPPQISGNAPASVVVGNAYRFTPTASDPDGDPLVFSVVNLPGWATFDPATGTLAGTPQTGEEAIYGGITITVNDPTSSATLPAFSITVSAANVAPVISGVPPTQVTVGQPYSFTPTASDANGDTLTFGIANMPSWAAFDPMTGALTGTPGTADVRSYPAISISVTDGSLSDTLPPFTIDVLQAANGSALLTWTAPAQNSDGSPLNVTDLLGYRIYYGTDAANLATRIDINDPLATSYTVGNLTTGTWHFETTAVNSASVESDRSNRASKTIN